MVNGDLIQRAVYFAIPMGVLCSIALYVGTLNPDFGWKGSLLAGGVYILVHICVVVIIALQDNSAEVLS